MKISTRRIPTPNRHLLKVFADQRPQLLLFCVPCRRTAINLHCRHGSIMKEKEGEKGRETTTKTKKTMILAAFFFYSRRGARHNFLVRRSGPIFFCARGIFGISQKRQQNKQKTQQNKQKRLGFLKIIKILFIPK